ncbi:GDSL esterase/lipase ACHE-like [Zingiber officinale]|uniref:Uncharacterized protein n=1 Tax=Zingiber officinale TaxID=94328 RepID=A0A8J5GIZ4_ZINOF|nr:GDSL esterase/lipase ACHE-like [Zingiber officinale]KAG6504664.1 hypothetical protein ZIOFF_037000 [Zingiber officinale]
MAPSCGGLSVAFGAAPPPYDESFFGKPVGRYCDVCLLVDFIGTFIHISQSQLQQHDSLPPSHLENHNIIAANSLCLPFLSAYLNSVGTNFSHGANFATAGSMIRQPYATLSQSSFSPNSIDVQTWEFSQFKSRSQALIQQGLFKDQLPKEKYFSQALYTIDIGQNDLTESYFRNWTTDEVKSVIPDILDKFVLAIKSIYWEGGRHGGKYNYNINIGCGSTVTKNGKEIMVGKACQNPSKRIIWNGVHYTDAVNKWIFQQIMDGKFSDSPVPLRLACKVKA